MNNDLLKSYYDSFKTKAFLCLYPGMSCTKKPIKAHSIQNSRVFDLLQENDHLIGLRIETDSAHMPTISYASIGRNLASTFEGLCEEHDNQLFLKIDNAELDISNNEQLFLIAYRSVLKELHASMSKAIKLQTAYQKKIDMGLINGFTPSKEALIATQGITDSFETYNYKRELDEAFLQKNYCFLVHRIFEIETSEPTLACSQLFSNNSVRFQDSVSRIIMNIFPISHHLTLAIFSSVYTEKELMDDYLYKCLNTTSYSRYYEVSKLVLRNSENFFLSPRYFAKCDDLKKEKTLDYFKQTVFEDKDIDDINFYLF